MKKYIALLGCVAVAGCVIVFFTGWPIAVIAFALFVGWPLLGTLLTIDDDLPGGWSNPEGAATSEWKTLDWHVDILLCRGSFVVAALAFQVRQDFQLTLLLWGGAAVMAALGFFRLNSVARRNTPASPPSQPSP